SQERKVYIEIIIIRHADGHVTPNGENKTGYSWLFIIKRASSPGPMDISFPSARSGASPPCQPDLPRSPCYMNKAVVCRCCCFFFVIVVIITSLLCLAPCARGETTLEDTTP